MVLLSLYEKLRFDLDEYLVAPIVSLTAFFSWTHPGDWEGHRNWDLGMSTGLVKKTHFFLHMSASSLGQFAKLGDMASILWTLGLWEMIPKLHEFVIKSWYYSTVLGPLGLGMCRPDLLQELKMTSALLHELQSVCFVQSLNGLVELPMTSQSQIDQGWPHVPADVLEYRCHRLHTTDILRENFFSEKPWKHKKTPRVIHMIFEPKGCHSLPFHLFLSPASFN